MVTTIVGPRSLDEYRTFQPEKMVIGHTEVARLVCGEGGLDDVSALDTNGRLIAQGCLQLMD
jgi:hypothetical protein